MDERRNYPRFPAKWQAQVICVCRMTNERKTFHAITNEISAGGMSVHSEHNFCTGKDVIVRLAVPPLHSGEPCRVVEITGRTVCVVLTACNSLFRTGIEFQHFEKDGKLFLESNFANRFSTGLAAPKQPQSETGEQA